MLLLSLSFTVFPSSSSSSSFQSVPFGQRYREDFRSPGREPGYSSDFRKPYETQISVNRCVTVTLTHCLDRDRERRKETDRQRETERHRQRDTERESRSASRAQEWVCGLESGSGVARVCEQKRGWEHERGSARAIVKAGVQQWVLESKTKKTCTRVHMRKHNHVCIGAHVCTPQIYLHPPTEITALMAMTLRRSSTKWMASYWDW